MVFIFAMTFVALLLPFLFLCLCISRCSGQSGDLAEVEALVKKWAPLVWLSPKELYLPMSVEEYLSNVNVVDSNGNQVQLPWNQDLPKYKTKQLYLVPKTEPNDTSSFIFGRNPNEHPVSIYAVLTYCPGPSSSATTQKDDTNTVYDKKEGGLYFHVSYWLFYPYNEGKDVCFLGKVPTPQIFNTCFGKRKSIGNHLGDWEHMSLSFAGKSVPDKLFLAVHNAGAYYTYDEKNRYFRYQRKQESKRILPLPKAPKILRTQGDHPIIFSAAGSHGLWASSGEFEYVRVPKLTDSNGYGIPWKTWNNIEIYHLGQGPLPVWMAFKGKWGNPKGNCVLWQKLGLCEYTEGPSGIIRTNKDFYCYL
ncbi:unnamed protein product [Callosobruchus maculatus]|uniref:Vacuolar protein sorting-associated protein 62 n=1 Tax=Callosobruchus maculatus TaxID=64391 RepID=A0A653CAT0_CALMS|nr:unnamed protein product [Callosobruchus maculatus]